MEHTIELRIPSMLRVLADLGRHQVTRLVAETLFDLRASDEDDQDRNWFDAEKINNQMFWDDLMGIITRDDPVGAERAVRHIFFYKQELSRVIAIPSAPLASVLVTLVNEKNTRLTANSRCVYDVLLELQAVTIILGIETSRRITAPSKFHAVALDVHLAGVSDMSHDPIPADILKASWNEEEMHFDALDVGQESGQGGSPVSARKVVLETGACAPGPFLLHFSTDMTLTSVIEPVTEYPVIEGLQARTEERRVTSNHAARVRVV